MPTLSSSWSRRRSSGSPLAQLRRHPSLSRPHRPDHQRLQHGDAALTEVADWKVIAAVVAGIVSGLALVAATWFGGGRDRLARWAAVAIVALVSFAIYKEGVVRVDAGHLTVLFANAAVVWVAVGGRYRRWMLAAAVIVFVASLPVRPAGIETRFDPVANVPPCLRRGADPVQPPRRAAITADGRASMQATYAVAPEALAALAGHSVAVEPWEVGAAWAYELDWHPLPVFQNYSAYTSALDRLNAREAESSAGPERILRENTAVVLPEFPGPDLDGRFPGWDPPEQALRCPLQLRPALCGRTVASAWAGAGSLRAGTLAGDRRSGGRPVSPGADAQSGHGRLRPHRRGRRRRCRARCRACSLHARSRHAVVNGETRYRLVPETAGDGLLRAGRPRRRRIRSLRPGPGSAHDRRRRRLRPPHVQLLRGARSVSYERSNHPVAIVVVLVLATLAGTVAIASIWANGQLLDERELGRRSAVGMLESRDVRRRVADVPRRRTRPLGTEAQVRCRRRRREPPALVGACGWRARADGTGRTA